MKKRIVFLFGLLLVLICLSTAVAEDAVTPADQPFQNEAIEQAHLIAQAKLKKDYVYDPRLFTCILKAETDEAFEFTFNWVYSTVAIYTVSVPSDLDENHIEVIYNTDYSMDFYYLERHKGNSLDKLDFEDVPDFNYVIGMPDEDALLAQQALMIAYHAVKIDSGTGLMYNENGY